MVEQITIPSFVLYAEQSLRLGPGNRAEAGNIGVRSRAREGTGAQLVIGARTRAAVTHLVLAPSVALRDDVDSGRIGADTLTDHGIPLRPEHPFPAAALPPLPLPGTGSAGSQAVTVAEGEASALAPGSYGDLVVDGSLALSPGDYVFSTVTIGHRGTVGGAGAIRVLVTGYLSAGRDARIHPLFGQPAGQLRIMVAGTDQATAGQATAGQATAGQATAGQATAGQGAPTVSVGERAEVRALLAAPHGTVALADHVRLAGAVAGYVIVTGEDVEIRHEDGFPQDSPDQRGSQQLGATYGVPAGPGTLPVSGPVPGDTAISLAIGLPVRDRAGLQALITSVSDPKSAQFRQFISPGAFTATYGATAGDYQALQAWADAAGLTTLATFPSRLLLRVSGTAAQVQQALFVNLVYRERADGSLFVAADRDPSLNLSVPVLEIDGIGDAVLPVHAARNGTGAGGTYRAADLRTAYLGDDPVLQALDGSGQRVGVFGFPPYTGSSITGYYQDQQPAPGEVSPLPVPDVTLFSVEGPVSGGGAEPDLDVEMVYAMAPGAAICFFADTSSAADAPVAVLHAMATATPQLTVATCSWFWTPRGANAQQALDQMAAQGVSFFTASGDNGDVASPWDSQKMDHQTLVGGTILSTNSLGSGGSYPDPYYAGEGGWPSSGGGIMTDVPIPGYQVAIMAATSAANGGSTTQRNYPDVAMLAQDAEIFTGGSATGDWWGTSFAAPLWAGFTALANQLSAQGGGSDRAGFLNPGLYDIGLTRGEAGPADLYDACFHDIQDGASNGGFTAVPGYDLVTGLGSPKPALIYQLTNQLRHIRFVVGTGGDDLRGDSAATADVFLQNGGTFTVTLKGKNDGDWGNGSVTGPLEFEIPAGVVLPTMNEGLSGVRINLIQGGSWPETDDNWDISLLQVSLFNPGQPALCQLNLVGRSQLQDGSTGLVRLSGSPGGSGVGPSSPVYATGPGSGC